MKKRYSLIVNYQTTTEDGVDLYALVLKSWEIDADGKEINVAFGDKSTGFTLEEALTKIKEFTNG
jgi:hypothetical protein